MTRSLPAAITSALAASGAQPSLSVQISKLQTQLALFAHNSLNSAGLVVPFVTSAGTVLRFITTPGGTIAVNRITSPTTAGQWQTAAATVTTTARGTASCAIAQSGSTIRCFYYRDSTDQVVYRDSTDDGVTWSAETGTAARAWASPTACFGLAALSTTSVLVNSAAYTGFGQAASLIYQSIYSAGAWGAWANVGPVHPTWGQIRGMSCAGGHIIAGVQLRTQQTGCAVGHTLPGTPWTDWTQVLPMDNRNLGLTYAYPVATYDGTTYLLAAMLQDDGTVSGTAQTRTALFTADSSLAFRLVGYVGNTLANNAAALLLAGTYYLFDAQNVYTGNTAPPTLDVSADVLSLRISERPNAPQSISLVLANNAGQYTAAAALTPNATISIALGYNGTTVATHTAYIDSLALVAAAENLTCEISGRSVSKFLEQVISRALIYTGQTMTQLLAAIFSTCGLTLDPLPATAQFSQVMPCYMLQPGDTWAGALNRLANVYGFTTLDRATPSVTIVEPQVSDPSSWSYGQETLGIALAQHADQSTLIRVVGQSGTTTPAFADLTDDSAILLSGGERYRHIVDRNLTTSAQARIRAGRALRQEQQQAATGTLTVALNPAHELQDVITLTDSRLGLTAQPMRIVGIDWHIDLGSGEWLQHLQTQLP